MSEAQVVKAFLAFRPHATLAIRDLVAILWRQGIETWPTVNLAPDAFARDVAAVIPDEALATAKGADFYLARAALADNPLAVTQVCLLARRAVRRLHGRNGPNSISLDEAQQVVCERLFVRGRDGEARLGRYSGTGALAAWIRVVALRVLTDLARGRTTPTLGDAAEIEWLAACEEDPDVSYLKEHYRQGFKTAFHQAVGRLSPQQRNLLRHQLLRGLSIDKIAALYHVHRATAARWLEQARVDLRRFTREEMIEQCGVDRLQFDSVVRLIASRMEISLPRALGEHPSQS